jgi:hypothetical protein
MRDTETCFSANVLRFIVESDTTDVTILVQMLELLNRRRMLLFRTGGQGTTRNPSMIEQRMNWDKFSNAQREQSANFKRHLRMSKESFLKLLGYIRPKLLKLS